MGIRRTSWFGPVTPTCFRCPLIFIESLTPYHGTATTPSGYLSHENHPTHRPHSPKGQQFPFDMSPNPFRTPLTGIGNKAFSSSSQRCEAQCSCTNQTTGCPLAAISNASRNRCLRKSPNPVRLAGRTILETTALPSADASPANPCVTHRRMRSPTGSSRRVALARNRFPR